MQKPHFPILVLVAAIAAVSLCGMRGDRLANDGNRLVATEAASAARRRFAGMLEPEPSCRGTMPCAESESSVLPPSYKIVPYHWVDDADDQSRSRPPPVMDKVVPLDWLLRQGRLFAGIRLFVGTRQGQTDDQPDAISR